MVNPLSLPPVKFATLAVVGAKVGPERVIVQPTPAQDKVSEGTQLLASVVEIVLELAAALLAVVVNVNEAVPFGLLIVTAELAGNALNKAEARVAGLDVEL